MKKLVISLGGSLIVPEDVDLVFLKRFAAFAKKVSKEYKVIIVTGGGRTARKYIAKAREAGFAEDYLSLVGIESTRLNAALVAGFFQKFHLVPESFAAVDRQLKRERIVVCGALGFMPEMTSDGDAALLARHVRADLFLNLTNVDGLYTKDPKESGAFLIPKISYKDFMLRMHKISFKPGQHFVLDHKAAHIIQKQHMKTIILNGKNLNNAWNCLRGKKFIGTTIA